MIKKMKLISIFKLPGAEQLMNIPGNIVTFKSVKYKLYVLRKNIFTITIYSPK